MLLGFASAVAARGFQRRMEARDGVPACGLLLIELGLAPLEIEVGAEELVRDRRVLRLRRGIELAKIEVAFDGDPGHVCVLGCTQQTARNLRT